MKKAVYRSVFLVLFIFIIFFCYIYYCDAKARYSDHKYITIAAEKQFLKNNGAYSKNSYEIWYDFSLNHGSITLKDDEYHYITSFSDQSIEQLKKIKSRCVDITSLEVFLIMDHSYKNGINDAQTITSQLIKNTPYDKTCYWEDLIIQKHTDYKYIHKRKKGTSQSDIDHMYSIMTAVYYFHKYIFVWATIICIPLLLKIIKTIRQKTKGE